ncbi:MAG TPA: YcnI family protein [Sporichthyaceae bacterium]|jgi:uncharacterized protein YcnI
MTSCSRPAYLVRVGGLVLASATAAVLFGPSIAWAHVTVHSAEAVRGGEDAELVFRVPNESDNARTTKIEVNLPTDTPMLGVSVDPPSGWSAKTSQTDLPSPVDTDDGPVNSVVSKIVFSGSSISGDEYVDFPIAVGKLPDTPQLVFKVLQTYSDGNVVRWIEEGSDAPGAQEPEHPAPSIKLAQGGEDSDAVAPSASPSASAGSGPSVSAASSATDDYASKNDVKVALAVGVVGAALGLLGLGTAFAKRR